MPATESQKQVVLGVLKQAQSYLTALHTSLGGISALTSTSTADDIQAQVDAYVAARTNSRTLYGGISLPSLGADDAFTAVQVESAAA